VIGPVESAWDQRHPAQAWVAKRAAALVIAGGVALGSFLLVDLRDGVRDSSAQLELAERDRIELRDQVKEVGSTAAARDYTMRDRVRVVEVSSAETIKALSWILRSLERLERAAGTARNAPPAPALDPPDPQPAVSE
jgi:hypothetical protein